MKRIRAKTVIATINNVGIAISNRWNMNLIIGSPERDWRDRIYKVTGCYV